MCNCYFNFYICNCVPFVTVLDFFVSSLLCLCTHSYCSSIEHSCWDRGASSGVSRQKAEQGRGKVDTTLSVSEAPDN